MRCPCPRLRAALGIGLHRQRDPVLWSPAAVRHMAAAADALGWRSIGTAILLNEWFGQRVADVLKLPPLSVEGPLLVRQGKTGRRVALPVHLVPHLVQRLQAQGWRPGVISRGHGRTHRSCNGAAGYTTAFSAATCMNLSFYHYPV